MAGRNIYDPRVRELIQATGNPDLFPDLNIARSTVAGWLRGQFKPAIGTAHVSRSEVELYVKIASLERRVVIERRGPGGRDSQRRQLSGASGALG